MEYKIFSNKRIEPNNFSMDYGCSFCEKFNPKVIEIPTTTFLICYSCLHKMMKALEKAMMEDMI